MTKATVTLWNRYKYEFEMPKNPTIHNVAWEIAMAVHRSENRTKFTGSPRTYNYVAEALRQNAGTLNFLRYNGESDKVEDIYRAANELQNESPWHKVNCDNCNGEGKVESDNQLGYTYERGWPMVECSACNGHGYVWKRLAWRVGVTFDFAIVIDIDSHSKDNLKAVREYYQHVLGMRFRAFKTGGGYWLVGDKLIVNKSAFRYMHCRVLNPELTLTNYPKYLKGLMSLDKTDGKTFIPATPEQVRASEYYKAPANLDFDVAFTFLSIKREQSTLRQSAKRKGDRIIEIK